jgi:hypothetical protein
VITHCQAPFVVILPLQAHFFHKYSQIARLDLSFVISSADEDRLLGEVRGIKQVQITPVGIRTNGELHLPRGVLGTNMVL